MKRSDFLVLGGGPAGNQSALQLANAGFSVRVVDYRQTLGDKLCSGIVGTECVERYKIPNSLVRSRHSNATFHLGHGKSFNLELKNDGACVIDRVGYVQFLARQAETAGAEYMFGTTVRSIEVTDAGVSVVVNSGSDSQVLNASAIIVATGFNSQIARDIGVPSAGTPAFAAQSEVSCPDIEGIQVFSGDPLLRGWFGWLVPTGEGRGLLGVLGRGSPSDAYRRLAGSFPTGKVVSSGTGISTWGVPLQPAERTYSDRVLLVGDVAGHVKPTTGGGIYYSLRCADIAVDTLIRAAAENDFSATKLARYQSEWKALLASELTIGYAARRAFETIPSQQFGRLISIASKNGFLSAGLQFDWHSTAIKRGLRYAPFGQVLVPVKRLLSAVFQG
jgi:geranylgeranyl reductase family protein